jgi:glycosyltransferase involved in cell wall biosynthesis
MDEKQPLISIIIPTYNEAENIGALIRHLQSHRADAVSQIIVTDGGSTDDTRL